MTRFIEFNAIPFWVMKNPHLVKNKAGIRVRVSLDNINTTVVVNGLTDSDKPLCSVFLKNGDSLYVNRETIDYIEREKREWRELKSRVKKMPERTYFPLNFFSEIKL